MKEKLPFKKTPDFAGRSKPAGIRLVKPKNQKNENQKVNSLRIVVNRANNRRRYQRIIK